MIYENIITKEYINDNVRPFSGNDSLYCNCVREAISLDMSDLVDSVQNLLLSDLEGASEQDRNMILDLLDNGLRTVIAYFTYSRALRTAEATITKYGYTVKSNQDSYPADQDKIVADCTYYKNCAEKYLTIFFKNHPDLKDCDKPVRDQYLKCKIVGQ